MTFPCYSNSKRPRGRCPYFIYTVYDQALGKNGIYKFI